MRAEIPHSVIAAIHQENVGIDEDFRRPEQPALVCIIPAFNEGKNLVCLLPALSEALSKLTPHYSILVVDDGSTDDTGAVVISLAKHYPIRLLQLSRNFGKESAITAGLDHADADVVFMMDGDCQHPIDLLPVFFERWQEGFDMVYGVRADRNNESIPKRYAAKWFYATLSYIASIPIVPNAGDFRLFDRQVVEAMRALPERGRFMKGIYSWVGFKSIGISYQPAPRYCGHSQFNFHHLTRLAMTGFTSFTNIPLRVWSGIGAALALFSIFYGIYVTIRTAILGIDVPGWATLTVAITFMGGIQLFSIGILGEYIGRIFTEVKQRPVYLIRRRFGFKQQVHAGLNLDGSTSAGDSSQ